MEKKKKKAVKIDIVLIHAEAIGPLPFKMSQTLLADWRTQTLLSFLCHQLTKRTWRESVFAGLIIGLLLRLLDAVDWCCGSRGHNWESLN